MAEGWCLRVEITLGTQLQSHFVQIPLRVKDSLAYDN